MRALLRDRRVLLGAILLGGLLLRAAFAAYAYHVKPLHGNGWWWDPDGYDHFALWWLETGSFVDNLGRPMTQREPLYPAFLAVMHWLLGPSLLVPIVFNVLFGTLACWLVHAVTLRLFDDEAAALWACAFACIYPEWIYLCAFAYRETSIAALLLAWLLLWGRACRDPKEASPRLFVFMGLIYGMLCLIRSPVVPLGPLFMVVVLRRLEPRVWLKTLGPFVVCALLANGAWTARNYRVTGRLVGGASMGGSVMYNSLLMDYDKPEVPLEAGTTNPDDPVVRSVQGMSLAAADSVYYRASRDILFREPGRFWSAFANKVAKLWRPYPNAGWEYGHSYIVLKWAGLLSNGPLQLFGLLGAVLAWRRRAPVGFLLAVPLGLTFIFGLFWAVTRYRAPLMVSVLPLAGLAWVEFLRRAGALSPRKPGPRPPRPQAA